MTNYFKFIKFIAFLFFAFFFQSTAFGQSKIFSATGTGRLPGASANITDLGLPGAVTYQSGTSELELAAAAAAATIILEHMFLIM